MREKVRRCFGRYGSMNIERIVDGKKILWCTMMCESFPLCKECHLMISQLKKFRRINEDIIIYKFMKKNKLKFGRLPPNKLGGFHSKW